MAAYTWDKLWNDLMRDYNEFNLWHERKPKWWQFRKRRMWLAADPRKNWR